MSKFKSKSDVSEWYWPDFLNFCLKSGQYIHSYNALQHGLYKPTAPTEDNFWIWYITDGPMGVKEAGRWYTKEDIDYV